MFFFLSMSSVAAETNFLDEDGRTETPAQDEPF